MTTLSLPIGVEEEYQLCDPDSGDLTPAVEAVLAAEAEKVRAIRERAMKVHAAGVPRALVEHGPPAISNTPAASHRAWAQGGPRDSVASEEGP